MLREDLKLFNAGAFVNKIAVDRENLTILKKRNCSFVSLNL